MTTALGLGWGRWWGENLSQQWEVAEGQVAYRFGVEFFAQFKNGGQKVGGVKGVGGILFCPLLRNHSL